MRPPKIRLDAFPARPRPFLFAEKDRCPPRLSQPEDEAGRARMAWTWTVPESASRKMSPMCPSCLERRLSLVSATGVGCLPSRGRHECHDVAQGNLAARHRPGIQEAEENERADRYLEEGRRGQRRRGRCSKVDGV